MLPFPMVLKSKGQDFQRETKFKYLSLTEDFEILLSVQTFFQNYI